MSADVICLDRSKIRIAEQPAPVLGKEGLAHEASRFRYWVGASGRRYLHSAFSLRECPQVTEATYILCRVDPVTGERTVARTGRLENSEPSENLAALRHLGACIGASEVHLHLLAGTDSERRKALEDIEQGLLTEVDGPTSVTLRN